MDIVIIAEMRLHRIGSGNGYGFGGVGHREIHKFVEIADDQAETLLEAVAAAATAEGESEAAIATLFHERNRGFSVSDEIVFNIQTHNVQYGSPYARCVTYPALKVGARYFKLDEIKLR